MTFLIRLSLVFFLLWFIPWVWSFHLGVLIYFPYKEDGASRYVRVTGPFFSYFNDKIWIQKKDIPRACVNALVLAEDDLFYEHHGIDLESIEYALKKNHKLGQKRLGASTITQQLVKNAFLYRERTYVRKAREIIGAILLDALMSKEKQLLWYFNVVEFGPMIYGLNDAALYYFNKSAKKLSEKECVKLVSLLPSPNRFGRLLKANMASKAMERRSHKIMRALSRED